MCIRDRDAEIRDFIASVRTPLVFGSYDLDDAGEYNAAAFLAPDGRLLGMYRKSNPFPLTEYVPAWLDGPGSVSYTHLTLPTSDLV